MRNKQPMHNKLQAKLLSESTLENLDNYSLTPLPDNYRLWFEYACGTIEALNAEIDTLVTTRATITDSVCHHLFQQYLATADQRDVDEARIAISKMLDVVISQLKDIDGSTAGFCDSLDQCAEQLNDDPSIGQVKEIVKTITCEASKMRSTNLNITKTINNLHDEVDALRHDVDRLGQEALTDSLTQVCNRRGFDQSLKEITDKAAASGEDCTVLMADIDHFKRVNDNFGHQVGDKILRYVASTIAKTVRGSDLLARHGGEEFAILLPGTSPTGARQVADNIRNAVSSRQLTAGDRDQVIGRITLSIGIGIYQPGENLDDFIDRADRCMYAAKKAGRNQVKSEEAL